MTLMNEVVVLEKKSRTRKTVKNMIYAVLSQAVPLIFGFISRAVFLRYLNETYLGVNTLFTEILSMLSIADLGLSSIVLFSFFEPLAKENHSKLSALVRFYKKVYYLIASVIMVIGLGMIPFLRYIVNMDQEIGHIYLYYIMFLVNTVLSYLVAYKSILLIADQNNYYVSKVAMYARMVCTILQIFLIVFTKNYLLYIVMEILCTLSQNIIISRKVNKFYPYINVPAKYELDSGEKKTIYTNIKDGFIYKISGVLLNSTDNTIISIMLNVVAVARFNNYSMITTRIANICSVIFNSATGSIGNLIATESKQKRANIFMIMQTISNFLSGMIVTCVFVLLSDLIRVWIGSEYIIGNEVLVALILNVYFSIALLPIWAFRDATGMFRRIKYVMLLCAGINIILSVILGHFLGLSGIIGASALSRFLTYFWYEPMILYREYFGKKPKEYYMNHLYNAMVIGAFTLVMFLVMRQWMITSWLQLFVKGVVVGLISFLCYLLFYCWKKDFKYTYNYFKDKVKQSIRNNKSKGENTLG